jgi:hypothetical protein
VAPDVTSMKLSMPKPREKHFRRWLQRPRPRSLQACSRRL